MRALDWLRYSPAKDSGPIGYKTRIGLMALLPIAPFAFFVDPQTMSPLQTVLVCAAITWGVAVFAFGVKELFASVWKNDG